MPFYREKQREEKTYELRNAWMLETGVRTTKLFDYEQFARNCRELRHFGYQFEEMLAFWPKKKGRSEVRDIRTRKIKTPDERLGPELTTILKCRIIEMRFVCKKTGKFVYWYISSMRYHSPNDDYSVMWLSEKRQNWLDNFAIMKSCVVYHFPEEPLFAGVLQEYGLLN